MNLKDLVLEVGKQNLKYEDLLKTTEWLNRRQEILKRDDYYCTKCGLSETYWYSGNLVGFDKNQMLDLVVDGTRIIADAPYTSEKNIYLHVHHKFYVLGRLPWEYLDDELTTLCNLCHWELHQKETIKMYTETEKGLEDMNLKLCIRCNGAGVFPEYSHVQGGVCFECHGARYEELISEPVQSVIL